VRARVQIADARVSYVIEDSGIGIPDESRALVFEEFRQVDGTMTREFGGSGLGMALAQRLARVVQGEVTFASTPGLGSTFKLELPLRYGEEQS
jgi:signal transduction histidine kinase